jgi:hypothetical protein
MVINKHFMMNMDIWTNSKPQTHEFMECFGNIFEKYVKFIREHTILWIFLTHI